MRARLSVANHGQPSRSSLLIDARWCSHQRVNYKHAQGLEERSKLHPKKRVNWEHWELELAVDVPWVEPCFWNVLQRRSRFAHSHSEHVLGWKTHLPGVIQQDIPGEVSVATKHKLVHGKDYLADAPAWRRFQCCLSWHCFSVSEQQLLFRDVKSGSKVE